MDPKSNPNLSLSQAGTSSSSPFYAKQIVYQKNEDKLLQYALQVQLGKNRAGEDMGYRATLTDHLRERSPIHRSKKRAGALNVELEVFNYNKRSSLLRNLTAIPGEDNLVDALEFLPPKDRLAFTSQGRLHALFRVPASVSADGSIISAQATAENLLEHSDSISQFASKPVAYAKTREGDIFLVARVAGEVAAGSLHGEATDSFDFSAMDEGKKSAFEDALVGLLCRLHSSGLTAGGIRPSNLSYDNGQLKLIYPSISCLEEEGIGREYYELIATLCAYNGGSSLGGMQEARLRLAKKLYGKSVIARNAMAEKSGRVKKPHQAAAVVAEKFSQYL